MGNGDFKLIAALGAWLGISALPVLIFVSSLIGLVAAIVMRVAKGRHFAFYPRTDSFGLDNFYGKRFRMAGGQLVADPSAR